MALSKVISIEITDYSTKACEISYGKKLTTVFNTVEFENPVGSVEDAFVVDRSRYVLELKTHLNEAKIKCKDAIFVIASNKILSREVTIPDMKEKLISDYIEGEKANYFPMDVAEHQLTYCIIDRNADKKELKLIVYAAPITLVKSYNALAKELGFKIVRLDYSGNTEYQHLHVNSATSNINFYLAINEANTMFTILEEGKFALQRNMNFGSLQLVQHLIDEEYYGVIDTDEAMSKLVSEELIFPSYAEMMEYMPLDEQDSKLYECKKRLTDAIRPLVAGVSRVLEYYNTKNKNAEIGKIYVGGAGSRINGILTLIMSEFEGIELVNLDKLPGIKYSKSNSYMMNKSTDFMPCIGAAQLSSVNFNVVDDLEEKKNSQSFIVLTFAAAIIGAVALVGIPMIGYYGNLAKQKSLNKQIAALADCEKLLNDKTVKTSQYTELQSIKELTKTNNEQWNQILQQFEIMLPSSTQVSSVTSNEEGVTLTVTIPSKEEAAKLLVQLKQIPVFEKVSVNNITESDESQTGVKLQTFSVLCSFPAKEEVPPATDADAQTEADTTADAAATQTTTEGGAQ